ncbi:6-phosphogluconolactonase [Salidesulfovibrio onnuriiensis]|uniref:6-phosphogluconolactonase n=1 Tax=Salidesulfovibrio onnuriiensis TaxID=2583823 RepID=UPI0011CACAB2|nr:6-phosphogluconolactonase [Salidesulfovibrio onnuriiensis]
MGQVTIFEDAEALSHAAASFFVQASHRALERNGHFSVALSGGPTPKRFYELLADERYWRAVPWDRTHLFWGDDRAVGPEHEHSNYRLAHEAFIRHVPLPEANVHRVRGELGAAAAAEDYSQELVNFFGGDTPPAMDLAIMGIGDDGHTASLFSGSEALAATDYVMPVFDPPAAPRVDRVTLTFPAFAAAHTALFLVTEENKRDVLAGVLNGDPQYPASRFQAQRVIWYAGQAVAG